MRAIGHTHAPVKRAGVGTNSIPRVKISVEGKTRTVLQSQPDDANPNTAESMVKTAHRTSAFN
jgi:hypothetical protein